MTRDEDFPSPFFAHVVLSPTREGEAKKEGPPFLSLNSKLTSLSLPTTSTMVSLPSFVSSSYELLPSSSAEAVEGIKTRAKSAPRGVLYFLGAQLTLVLLAGLLFSGPPRSSPPGGPHGGDSGPYQWGGFDEMCVGEFGTYVCEEYG